MMLCGVLFLLLLTDGESSNRSCNYEDILKHLDFKKTDLSSMTRPAINHTLPTKVILDVLIYAILDVQEKDQKFVSYIWIDMMWRDHRVTWDRHEFCDIRRIPVPTKLVWRPDLTIEEMVEKDKAPPTPYLRVGFRGDILLRNDMVLVSSCRMRVHKFPFDVQSCDLSFKSVIHSDKELQLSQIWDSSRIKEWSRKVMRTQYEWLFMDLTFTNKTVNNFGIHQSMVIYTITMKRRAVLYIANFLLPVLFFMSLDLASFMISDSGGEKLGFKVTVLLAVTVMQLILNEILPSSSERIPLIAIYCIGIFGLMMLSLMETILVMYLLEKDNKADEDQSLSEDCGDQQGKVNFHRCFRVVNKVIPCGSVSDVPAGETTPELLQMATEGSSTQLMDESRDSEKLSDELREAVKTLSLFLSSRKEEQKPGYWTRLTKTINRVFLVFYVIAASVFLLCLFFMWQQP